jgi:hypothetical protein
MKKRNKNWLKEKSFIRLQLELDKNHQAQRNLGWIELENPRFIGWIAKYNPRGDIQNREDAWIFWEICEKLGTKCHSRKIELFDWNKKKRRNQIISYPSINEISEDYYLSLEIIVMVIGEDGENGTTATFLIFSGKLFMRRSTRLR